MVQSCPHCTGSKHIPYAVGVTLFLYYGNIRDKELPPQKCERYSGMTPFCSKSVRKAQFFRIQKYFLCPAVNYANIWQVLAFPGFRFPQILGKKKWSFCEHITRLIHTQVSCGRAYFRMIAGFLIFFRRTVQGKGVR